MLTSKKTIGTCVRSLAQFVWICAAFAQSPEDNIQGLWNVGSYEANASIDRFYDIVRINSSTLRLTVQFYRRAGDRYVPTNVPSNSILYTNCQHLPGRVRGETGLSCVARYSQEKTVTRPLNFDECRSRESSPLDRHPLDRLVRCTGYTKKDIETVSWTNSAVFYAAGDSLAAGFVENTPSNQRNYSRSGRRAGRAK